MMSKGIIEPTKVVRAALQGAASVAGLLITTEAMVAELPQKKGQAMPGGGGMVASTTDRLCLAKKARRQSRLFRDAPSAKGVRNAYAPVWTKAQATSTVVIKHGILRMMLQEELKAQATAANADEDLVAHGRGTAAALNDIETRRRNAVQCI